MAGFRGESGLFADICSPGKRRGRAVKSPVFILLPPWKRGSMSMDGRHWFKRPGKTGILLGEKRHGKTGGEDSEPGGTGHLGNREAIRRSNDLRGYPCPFSGLPFPGFRAQGKRASLLCSCPETMMDGMAPLNYLWAAHLKKTGWSRRFFPPADMTE